MATTNLAKLQMALTSLTASVLTLTAISCDRFVAVLFPLRAHMTQQKARLPDWFADMEYAAYFIAYSNSAANPVIYCGFNAHFRQGLIAILHCSLIQDFKMRAKRGKSSTMTTNAGSGRIRETPTTLTANFLHEISELTPQCHQRPDVVNHLFRRRNSGDFEEVTLRSYVPTQTLYTLKTEGAV
uniref:G-protein coupled receptors family 1 profile domain-containing protein n=1 Tax=Strigamia maritima TaxID=126957 RepID=T1IRV9_STRMM